MYRKNTGDVPTQHMAARPGFFAVCPICLLAQSRLWRFERTLLRGPPAKSVVFAGYATLLAQSRLWRFERTLLRGPPAKSVVFAGYATACRFARTSRHKDVPRRRRWRWLRQKPRFLPKPRWAGHGCPDPALYNGFITTS